MAKKKTAPAPGAATFSSVGDARARADVQADVVDEARAALPEVEVLTNDERLRTVKVRVGAEPHVRAMDAIAAKLPDVAKRIGVTPGELSARWDAAEARTRLRSALAGFLKALDDTDLKDKGTAWKKALQVYEIAGPIAAHDPTIREPVEAFRKFLSRGKRGGAEAEVEETASGSDDA